jgi:hypothetical protein
MNLKTTRVVAVEDALQDIKSKSFKLLGISKLVQSPNAPSFLSLFGTDHKFFYVAEKIYKDAVKLRERGIGRVIQNGADFYLERSLPLAYYINGDSHARPCYNGPVDFYLSEGEQLVVSSSFPLSHTETLCDSYCVLASNEEFSPVPIKLTEFSFLSRLDGPITSVSFSSIKDVPQLSESILESVTSYNKQISLGASKLSMKSKRGVISSHVFQLNPTSNPPTKKGTLIYDENDDILKYYDGASWRSLSFIKDNLS